MKTTLACAALAALGFLAIGSAANAQTGVQGCYFMLPNQVIVTCDHVTPGTPGQRFGAVIPGGNAAEPATTGSIPTRTTAPVSREAVPHSLVVNSISECKPGMFWERDFGDSTVMTRCS